jgi:hypothetical protein
VVVPQVDLHQDGIYCGLAMENQDFTTKIPELSTKTENLQSCGKLRNWEVCNIQKCYC